MQSEQRTVELLVDTRWAPIQFKNLKKGDIFRMFEDTGEPVLNNGEDKPMVALSDAYVNDNQIDQIDIEE